jgi:hypothetical protein
MEEVASSWLTYKPINCSLRSLVYTKQMWRLGSYQNIVPAGVILARPIITQDHLAAWVIGVALIAEEFGHVLDILMATAKLILAAGVVDADKQ